MKQSSNKVKRKTEHLAPYQYKKGQSGNPAGRPEGILSMKEWAKKKLLNMTEAEREEWAHGLNKVDIWEMAEGKPKQDTELKGNLTISQVLDELDGSKTEGQGVENQPPLQDPQ